MKDARLFVTLVTPSPISFIISFLFSGLVLLGASWSGLRSYPTISPFLSGDYSFSRLLHDANVWLSDLFSSDLSYNIAVIVFAVLFGGCVYFMVQSIRHILSEARTTLDEMEYSDQRSKEAIERSLGLRFVLRLSTAVVWLGYTIFFFNGVLPFCSSLISKGSSMGSFSPLKTLIAFALLVVTCHLHVIFVRLIALRPRLFGLQDVVIGRGGH